MRLTIHIHAPEGESLLVTVGGQTQRCDKEHRSLQFNLLAGAYPVEFRQETEGHSFHIAKLLAFLIFMVPWGILNVLLMNVDTGWWKNCKTFCLKVETAIDLQQDEELSFRFVNAKYEESRRGWRMPEYQMEPPLPVRETPQPHPISLTNGYLSFFARMVSVYSVLALLMGTLSYYAFSSGIMWGGILCLGILVGCSGVVAGVAVYHYRKLRKLRQEFSTQLYFQVEKTTNKS